MNDLKKTKGQLIEELTESKAILQAIIESLPFDFFAVGPDGRYLVQNATSKTRWGEAIGKRPEDVAGTGETLALWRENNRRAFAGERVEEEVELTVNGEKRFYNNVIAPIREDDRVRGILGVNLDVTERKRAEGALRESERRYRTLAESSNDFIYLLDRQGTLLYANQAALACMGLSRSEIVGKRQADLFPAETAAAHLQRIDRVFATGETLEADEFFHFGSTDVWLQTHLVPLRDDAGRVTSVMGICHDVTERKRAEEALRKARDELEEKVRERTAELVKANEDLAVFRRLADGSNQGFGIADLNGIIQYSNPTMCRLGGGENQEERLGKSFLAMMPAETRKIIEEVGIPATLRNGHWTGEVPLSTTGGEPLLTLQSASLIRDENGKPYRMAVVVTDITAQKQAEAKLQQNRDELQAIYDGMVDGLLIADVETTRFVRANASICKMLGYSEDELLSMSVADIHPAADVPAVVEAFQAGARRQSYVHENMPILRKDGSVFFADIGNNRIVYAGRLCVIGFFRDISERREAERTRAHFSAIVNSSRDAITGGGADGLISVWNAAAQRLYGYTAEEAIGQSVFLLTPPDRVAEMKALLEKVNRGEGTDSLDTVRRRKDGTLVDVSLTLSPIWDARGQVVGASVIVRDITERKQAQAALERERQTLKHLLQSSDHERQLIAYEIHDGLAQQLAGASMQFQTYWHLKDAKPRLAARAYDAAMTMLRQGHFEARRLISGVRPPILDESGVVAAVAHLVNEQRLENGPTIELLSEVEFNRLAPIQENAVYRIVQEGLANACRHSRSQRVRVELVQQRDCLRIMVRDWGVGFSTTEIAEGRFGLHGIRERARLLGGQATFQSAPGEGACITVELPLVLKE